MRAAIFAIVLCGCNTSTPPRLALQPTDDEARAASAIPLLPPDGAEGARPIGAVEGSVCKVGLHDPEPTKDEALAQLRIAAIRTGANAVIGTGCEDAGMSLTKNCFASITCRGTAVRVGAPPDETWNVH
jgi:hypothetical protein